MKLPSTPLLNLPPSPEVQARFERLHQREVVLEMRGLGKVFHGPQGETTALRGIDFQVHRREFVCIIGPSGCGKSTLIRILAGLDNASSGEVLLDGAPVKGPGRDRGMVFQGYSLFPWLTVKGNVMFGPRMAGQSATTAESRAREWLELVGLTRFADAYPHQLSGGMRQRVAIARALALEPDLVVCDEPVSALDVSVQAQVLDLLAELQDGTGLTYLFISHDLAVVRQIAHRVAVMKAGRVVETGPTGALFGDPAHDYTRELLAAIPGGDARIGAAGARLLEERT
jgi:NitT/TauT family transport system ATP-binding protein